jgi:hypothetical protein
MGSDHAGDAPSVSVGGTTTLVIAGRDPRSLIAENDPPELARASFGVPLDRRGELVSARGERRRSRGGRLRR